MRDTDTYKNMDTYSAVGLAEGFKEPSTDDPEFEILCAWQKLHDSGLAYKLQGFFGRGCAALIADGRIEA